MIARLEDFNDLARGTSSIVKEPKSSTITSDAEWPDVAEKETSGAGLRVGAAAGFLLVMAIIGSATALAWRAHNGLASLARAHYADMDEIEKAIRRVELVQGQITQHVDALQAEQKIEQSRLAEIQRLSEKLTSLQAALERATKSGTNQEPQKRHSTSSASPKTGASNLPSGTAP